MKVIGTVRCKSCNAEAERTFECKDMIHSPRDELFECLAARRNEAECTLCCAFCPQRCAVECTQSGLQEFVSWREVESTKIPRGPLGGEIGDCR